MSVSTVRRLAANILKVGKNKIKMKQEDMPKIREALTRGDVENLIKDKIITLAITKGRATKNQKRKKRGKGKIKNARKIERKEKWMEQVRSQRRYLKKLLGEGKIQTGNKRHVYMKIKSGTFKSKMALMTYLEENNLVNKGDTNDKS